MFQREDRYIIIKRSDLINLPGWASNQLDDALEAVRYAREGLGKQPLQAVVVEADWPEYETVWKMLEARVKGVGMAPEPGGFKERIASLKEARHAEATFSFSLEGGLWISAIPTKDGTYFFRCAETDYTPAKAEISNGKITTYAGTVDFASFGNSLTNLMWRDYV
jgi:hypothetical protein